MSPALRDLIALVGAVVGNLRSQAAADAADAQKARIGATVLKAYRWQYIVSGVMEPRFQTLLFGLIDDEQAARIHSALAPLTYAVPMQPEVPLPMAA